MKTALLLISTFLLISTGCGSSKNNLNTPIHYTEKISKIIIDRTSSFFAPREINIISTQELFESTIFELTEIENSIHPNATKDKERILSWIKSLQDANVDFNQNNILIYTFEQHSICEYKENSVLKNAQQVNITFIQTSEICMEASTLYYLAYKVSKDIEKVSIKAFEQEYVIIDMS